MTKIFKTTHHLFRDGTDQDFPPKTVKTTGNKPTPHEIAKVWGGNHKEGDYWAGAGRCYEFADQLHWNMKQVGYKNHSVMDNNSWLNKGHNHSQEFRDILADPGNNHAWVHYNGKHYDSLNPEGVTHPSKLKFFVGKMKRRK